MKKLYSFIVVSAFVLQGEKSFTQSFTFTPTDTLVYGAPSSQLVCDIGGNMVKNITNGSIILDFIRLQDVDIVGSGWNSSFCLSTNCFAPVVDSSRITLLKDSATLLLPHFVTSATPDSQTVYFKIKQVGAPNQKVYQHFHGVTQLTFGVNEESAYMANVNIYPSPVSAGNTFSMNITNVVSKSKDISLVVYNIYGSVVGVINTVKEGNNTLDLNLAAGIYSYSLVSGNARIHSGKLVIVN